MGNVLEEYLSLLWGLTPCFTWPHSCTPVKPWARKALLSSRTPPPNQPQPCKDRLSKEETAWICLFLFARRGDISFWHCASLHPAARPELPGRQAPAHSTPLVLLVRLPQVSRPAQSWPRSCSCPSSFELRLRHVIWVEGGRLASFKSSLKEERIFTFCSGKGTLLLPQHTQARSPTEFVAALLPATDLLLALSNATLAAALETVNHGATCLKGGGEGKDVCPANPCTSPSSGEW